MTALGQDTSVKTRFVTRFVERHGDLDVSTPPEGGGGATKIIHNNQMVGGDVWEEQEEGQRMDKWPLPLDQINPWVG